MRPTADWPQQQSTPAKGPCPSFTLLGDTIFWDDGLFGPIWPVKSRCLHVEHPHMLRHSLENAITRGGSVKRDRSVSFR